MRAVVTTVRDERAGVLSPDGRWIFVCGTEAGREEQVYMQPYPGPGERVIVSQGGGREPIWSPTGKEIFCRSNDGQRMLRSTSRRILSSG
jgi:Tol biopolymer transport system component